MTKIILLLVAVFFVVEIAHGAEIKSSSSQGWKQYNNINDRFAAMMRLRNNQDTETIRILKWPHLQKCFDHYWYNDRETWHEIMESPYIDYVNVCAKNQAKATNFHSGVLPIYVTMRDNQASRRRRMLETASETVKSGEALTVGVGSNGHTQMVYNGYKPTWRRISGHLCDTQIFDGVKYDRYGRFNWKCSEAPQLCKCIAKVSKCFKNNNGGCQLLFEGNGNLELQIFKSGNDIQYSVEKDGTVLQMNDINGGKSNKDPSRRRLLSLGSASGSS